MSFLNLAKHLTLTVIAAAITGNSVHAQFTWDGGDGSSQNWSDDNWTGTAPADSFSGSFVFAGGNNTGTSGTPINNDLTGGTMTGITFDSAASAFFIGGEAFTLTGGISFNGNPGAAITHTIENDISLGATTITLRDNGNLTLSGNLTSGSINLNGDGILTLGDTTNTFTRITANDNATVRISNFDSLGSQGRLLGGQGNDTATLEYTGAAVTTDFQARWGLSAGTGGMIIRNSSASNGTITFSHSTFNLIPGNINGNGDARNVEFDTNTGDIVVQGIIQNPDSVSSDITSLTKMGSGNLTLEGVNLYTGNTTVSEGTLILNKDGTLNTTSGITVSSGATLQQNSISSSMINDSARVTVDGTYDLKISETIGSLAGNGVVTGNGTSGITLTVGNDNTNSTFSGRLTQGANSLALTKMGTGTFTLSNSGSNSDYTGQTRIDGGTLQLGGNGSLGNTGSVRITNGTLDLNGFDQTIGNVLTLGGVASGNANVTTGAGTLTMKGTAGRIDIDYLSAGNPLGATIDGNFELDPFNDNVIFEIQDSSNAAEDLIVNAIISNVAAKKDKGVFYLTKGGTMTLNGANTFDMASLEVRGGTWVLGTNDYRDGTTAGALGMNDEAVIVGSDGQNDDATLLLKAGVTTNRNVTVANDTNQPVTRTLGGFDNSGTATFSGQVAMNNSTIGSTRLTAETGSTVVFSGTISGSGVGIEKVGGGNVRLDNANTFNGNVLVSEGTLILNADQAISSSNNVTVSSGASLQQQDVAGSMIKDTAKVIVDGTYQIDKTERIGSLSGNGVVSATDLNSSGTSEFTLLVGGDNTSTTFSGQLTESTNRLALTKEGSGTLILTNAGGNSDFTGLTTITGGGTLQLGAHQALGNTKSATIRNGTLDLNGFDQTIQRRLDLAGVAGGNATINTGAGTLKLQDDTSRLDIVYNKGGNPLGATINGKLELDPGNTNVVFVVGDSSNAVEDLVINAVISNGSNMDNVDKGTFYISGGDGTMVLNGENTFDMGALNVRAGTWVLGTNDYSDGMTAGALGRNDEAVVVGSNGDDKNASLLLKAGVISDRDIFVSGDTSVARTRTLGGFDGSGTSTFSGDVTLNAQSMASVRVSANTGSTVVFSGIIRDNANTEGIEKIGGGIVRFAGSNTYDGNTTISDGTLELGGGNTTGSLSPTSTITINAPGLLAFNRSDAISQGTHFSTAAISGSGGIVQIGSGTTTLTADNNYTGTTEITDGTLLIDGDQSTATGDVTVGAAGTLGGSGTIGGNTTINGTHTAGTAGTADTQNFSNNLTYNTSTITWDLIDESTGQFDQFTLDGSGTLDFAGGASSITFNIDDQDADFGDTSRDFLIWSGYNTLTGFHSDDFNISYSGPSNSFGVSSGDFAFVNGPDAGLGTGVWLRFSTPVPEPSTYALMSLGLAAFGWHRRRRKQTAAQEALKD